MLKYTKIISLLMASALFTACTSDKKDKQVIDTSGILKANNMTAEEKSEELSLSAEQLMAGTSFMYADAVAEVALAFNKDNKRAQLIRALTAPAMKFKGIMSRIKPVAERNERSKASYQRQMDRINKAPNHALKTFLLSGAPDIKNEKDIQALIQEVTQAITNLRLFFKNNKDVNLTLNIPGEKMQKNALDNAIEDGCYWEQSSEGYYEWICEEDPNLSETLQVKLNRADMEALQQVVAGYEIYFKLLNSYTLDGAFAVGDKYRDVYESPRNQIREELLANPEFGKLRNKASLSSILEMGLDAVSGARWALKIESELCPEGYPVSTNRKGHLFKEGLCLTSYAQRKTDEPIASFLDKAELVLSGGIIDATFRGYNTQTKYSAVFSNPIQDVRNLGLKFDACGNISEAADQTFGGVLVNNDAAKVIEATKKECYQ